MLTCQHTCPFFENCLCTKGAYIECFGFSHFPQTSFSSKMPQCESQILLQGASNQFSRCFRRPLLPSERSYYLLCFPFRSCFFVRSYLGVHKGNEFIPPLFTSTVSAQRIARKKTGFLTCGELDDYPLSWYPDLAIYFCFLYVIQS